MLTPDTNDVALAPAPTLAALEFPPREAFERLQQAGFRFVQLSVTQPGLRPRELDRSARRDLAASLRRRGISISGLDAWIPASHFLEMAQVDRAVAAVLDAITLAGDLGRCPVSVLLPRPASEAQESGWRSARAVIVTEADRQGIALADHGLPIVDDDAIGVGVDPPIWIAAGEDPVVAVARNAARLVSMRLCDLLVSGMRGPIGSGSEGRLDVEAYRVAGAVSGYARPVVIDARQWADPWSGVLRTAETWEAVAGGPAA